MQGPSYVNVIHEYKSNLYMREELYKLTLNPDYLLLN